MSFYEEQIIKATKCSQEDASEVEEYMRDVIFHSTLDWIPLPQFNKGAREAYKDILWMRSPEGQAYIKELKDEFLK